MEIKNYLHLYLGCDVMVKYYHSEKWEGPMTFTIRLLAESQNTGKFSYHPEQFKPILRPLSDMTEEDLQMCGNMVYDFSDDPELNNHQWKDFEIGLAPEQFHWLLSKHFDLFGLIENGLAIDATKLNAGKTNT